MYKVTKYPHGTFSWADCASVDAPKAKQFYADVMGWTMDEIPLGDGNTYTMFHKDGETVAALSPMQPELQAHGHPSYWSNYVTVDDVDALVGRVTELGGTVMAEPFDVFDQGRMMVIQDPTHAVVSLWQANKHIGAYLVNTPGAMTWNELSTTDTEKAKAFYGALLGWTFAPGPQPNYTLILNNGRMNGGIIQMDESWAGIPPTWWVYFSVADIDETVAKATASGGELIREVIDEATGQIAIIKDPAGAVANYIQLVNPEAWSD